MLTSLGMRAAMAGAVFVLGWILFSILSNVDMGDVVAYNRIERHVGTDALSAGDLVEISPDGTRLSPVCSLDVAKGDLKERDVAKSYVNLLSEKLEQYTDAVFAAVGRAAVGPVEAADPGLLSQIPFVGKVSTFSRPEATPPMSADCVCAVARVLVQRSKVCTVEMSLIETVLVESEISGVEQPRQRTVGVTLKRRPVLVDLASLNCPGIADANLDLPLDQSDCSDGLERRFDVALRQSMGFIREKPLPMEVRPGN